MDEGDDFIIPAGPWSRPCWTLDELMNSIECSAVEAEGHDSPEVSVLSFIAVRPRVLNACSVFYIFPAYCADTAFYPRCHIS